MFIPSIDWLYQLVIIPKQSIRMEKWKEEKKNGRKKEINKTQPFHSPGKLIAPEHTQTAAINAAARLRVIRIGYVNGSVMAQYRSNDITHKFNMEAVLNRTSSERQISHQSVPKNHVFSSTSYSAENGITTKPTKQSATANDVTNKLVDVCKYRSRMTANMTSELPNTVANENKNRNASRPKWSFSKRSKYTKKFGSAVVVQQVASTKKMFSVVLNNVRLSSVNNCEIFQ